MSRRAKNDHVYPNATRQPRQDAKFRVDEAKDRQDFYDKLSTREKIDLLDKKLGVGEGAKKQRAKLASALAKTSVSKAAPMESVEPEETEVEEVKSSAKARKTHSRKE